MQQRVMAVIVALSDQDGLGIPRKDAQILVWGNLDQAIMPCIICLARQRTVAQPTPPYNQKP